MLICQKTIIHGFYIRIYVVIPPIDRCYEWLPFLRVTLVHANYHGMRGCDKKNCQFQVIDSFQLGLTKVNEAIDFYLVVKLSKDNSNTMLMCVSPSLGWKSSSMLFVMKTKLEQCYFKDNNSLPSIVVGPSNFVHVSIPNWRQRGTLSTEINDHPMVWPLHP